MKEDATMVQARHPPSGFPSLIIIGFGRIVENWTFGGMQRQKLDISQCIHFAFQVQISCLCFVLCFLKCSTVLDLVLVSLAFFLFPW